MPLPSSISTSLANTVATPVIDYCKANYSNNVFIDKGIKNDLQWAPTILVKKGPTELIAIEVSQDIYPLILKETGPDIKTCVDLPVSVYVACPLSAYIAPANQSAVRKLKEHGFGLLTVDDENRAVEEKIHAIPLILYIAKSEFNNYAEKLPQRLRLAFSNALEAYQGRPIQGLQESGQIIESLIDQLGQHCLKKGWIPTLPGQAANNVEKLISVSQLSTHKSSLIRARSFITTYRNMASHPARSMSAYAKKICECKHGFIESITTAQELCVIFKSVGATPKYIC
ncbi:MAG: hypothetical protein AB1400_08570 [Pseudomonadota bacterium]